MKGLFVFTVIAATISVALCNSPVVSEEFIKAINAKATTWTAGNNFVNYTTEELKALTGIIGIYSNSKNKLPVKLHEARDGIPDTFDSREVWPECESLRTIRNQEQCGSCWAFAAVEVMSDRLCIFTAGAKKFTFSPEELISCCSYCGSGCAGGYLNEPFNYWQRTGIPSGGDYGSNLGCRPYTARDGTTPQCNERCVSGYSRDWNSDVRHGIAAYEVTPTVEQMQHEIVINGPVVAFLRVYDDFYHYNNGIYQHVTGEFVGNHAIKIVGWGSDNGVPYWLIANSWGASWGENGFFRIIRGVNDSEIESYVTAGIPNTDE